MRLPTLAALILCCAVPTAYADEEAGPHLKTTYLKSTFTDDSGLTSEHFNAARAQGIQSEHFEVTMLEGVTSGISRREGDAQLSLWFNNYVDDEGNVQVVADVAFGVGEEVTEYQTQYDFGDSTVITKRFGDATLRLEIEPEAI